MLYQLSYRSVRPQPHYPTATDAATALETSGIPTPPLIWYNPTRNPQRMSYLLILGTVLLGLFSLHKDWHNVTVR